MRINSTTLLYSAGSPRCETLGGGIFFCTGDAMDCLGVGLEPMNYERTPCWTGDMVHCCSPGVC